MPRFPLSGRHERHLPVTFKFIGWCLESLLAGAHFDVPKKGGGVESSFNSRVSMCGEDGPRLCTCARVRGRSIVGCLVDFLLGAMALVVSRR
jgi:hypothetical protein